MFCFMNVQFSEGIMHTGLVAEGLGEFTIKKEILDIWKNTKKGNSHQL